MEVSAFTQPLSEGQRTRLCNHCPRRAEHAAASRPLPWPVSGRLSCHQNMPSGPLKCRPASWSLGDKNVRT